VEYFLEFPELNRNPESKTVFRGNAVPVRAISSSSRESCQAFTARDCHSTTSSIENKQDIFGPSTAIYSSNSEDTVVILILLGAIIALIAVAFISSIAPSTRRRS
jgi:hypothetical protein